MIQPLLGSPLLDEPLCRIDPNSAKREMLLWSAEDEGVQRMRKKLSLPTFPFWVLRQPGAGLSLTPCSKQMRMFNTVNV